MLTRVVICSVVGWYSVTALIDSEQVSNMLHIMGLVNCGVNVFSRVMNKLRLNSGGKIQMGSLQHMNGGSALAIRGAFSGDKHHCVDRGSF